MLEIEVLEPEKPQRKKKKKGNLTDWFGAGDGVKITLCMAQSYDRDKE